MPRDSPGYAPANEQTFACRWRNEQHSTERLNHLRLRQVFSSVGLRRDVLQRVSASAAFDSLLAVDFNAERLRTFSGPITGRLRVSQCVYTCVRNSDAARWSRTRHRRRANAQDAIVEDTSVRGIS